MPEAGGSFAQLLKGAWWAPRRTDQHLDRGHEAVGLSAYLDLGHEEARAMALMIIEATDSEFHEKRESHI